MNEGPLVGSDLMPANDLMWVFVDAKLASA